VVQIAPLFRPVQPSHRIRTPKAVSAAVLIFFFGEFCAAALDLLLFADILNIYKKINKSSGLEKIREGFAHRHQTCSK
jgi:hypothetical protein